MGWADCGTDSKGRQIGYAFAATCDHPGCTREIDRGLSYACGGMHGENGDDCEGYFCTEHLSGRYSPDDGHYKEFCQDCAERMDEVKVEEFRDLLVDFLRPAEPPLEIRGYVVPVGDKVCSVMQGETVRGWIVASPDRPGVRFRSAKDPDGTSERTLPQDEAEAFERLNQILDVRLHEMTRDEHKQAIYALMERWDDFSGAEPDPLMTPEQLKLAKRDNNRWWEATT